MTPIDYYELAKYWLPALTIGGIFLKLVKNWLDKLLEGHLEEVRLSLQSATTALTDLATSGKEIMGTQREFTASVQLMQHDFHDHIKEDERVQAKILTDLEVIKVQTK